MNISLKTVLLPIVIFINFLGASVSFAASLGTGRVTDVTAGDNGCKTVSGDSTQFYNVQQSKTYKVTLSNVTECSGGTIGILVKNTDNGNQCLTASSGSSSGTYTFTVTMPPDACNTYPIQYCVTACKASTGFLATRSDGGGFGAHLRAGNFDADCNYLSQDTDCTGHQDGDPCDDGNACTTDDQYQNGICVGSPLNCDDSNACTTDRCDQTAGCIHTDVVCLTDDNDACTTNGYCDKQTGCVNPTPISCDDQDVCTLDSCNPATGCLNVKDTCDDHIECTADSCVQGQGCLHVPENSSCDDKNPCTKDICDPQVGCRHEPVEVGTVCREAAGDCDVAEMCDGTGAPCPQDSFKPVDAVCRPAAGECDKAETCTGSSPLCPADAVKPAETSCGDDGNVCTRDICDGSSVSCTHPAGNGGTVCRQASDLCDQNALCTGTSSVCPSNPFKPASVVCRGAHGVCDTPESCTGSSAACPADAFLPNTVTCRPSAGVCDTPESCTGNGPDCPNDVFKPSTTVCRPAAGECDVPDNCSGLGAACTDDAKKAPNTACTDDGIFCTADLCDGTHDACQHPTAPKDGVVCDDSNACTQTDLCQSGSCVGSNRIPGVVSGMKYYDANANGQWDSGEVGIGSWSISYSGPVSATELTNAGGLFSNSLANGAYTFKEMTSSGWQQTGNLINQTSVSQTGTPLGNASCQLKGDKSYSCQVAECNTVAGVDFGNLCLGSGGGLTLGFWSNKNGQALFSNSDLAAMVGLNLRNANGSAFDPTSYTAFRNWILSATATNMANMLSAQLAAMKLNVRHNFVSGNALIYAPGANSANGNGYATVNAVMAEADASLAANGNTVKSDATRSYQEALKNALDNANNNRNFVQAGPNSCGPHL